MSNVNVCPVCTGSLIEESRKIPFTYKGRTIQLDQPAHYCQNCGEAFLSPVQSRSNETALKAFRNEVDGLLTPDEIKAIRKRLHLSQAEAAKLFGGGPMAFSKYERGAITHSRALDIVLRLLNTGSVSIDTVKAIERDSIAV